MFGTPTTSRKTPKKRKRISKKGKKTPTKSRKKSETKKTPNRYDMYNHIKATLSEAMMQSYRQIEEERLSKSLIDVPRLNLPDKSIQYDQSKKRLNTKNGEFLCDICKQPVEIKEKGFSHRCKSKFLKYTNSPSYDKRVSIVKSYLAPASDAGTTTQRHTPKRKKHPPRPSSQLSNISLTSPPKPLYSAKSKSTLYNHSMDHILKQLEKRGKKRRRMERRPVCLFLDEEDLERSEIKKEIQPLYSPYKQEEKPRLTGEERRRARKLAARWMTKVNTYLTKQALKLEHDRKAKRAQIAKESARRRAIRREYESMVLRSIYKNRENQLTPIQERRLHQRSPCGLTYAQIRELQSRELTSEDYAMLLTLDESVQKKTVPLEMIESFPVFFESEVDCLICMNALDEDEEALLSEPIYDDEDDDESDKLPSTTTLHATLQQPPPQEDDFQVHDADSPSSTSSPQPSKKLVLLELPLCKHRFHKVCIKNWLLNQSTSCPICKTVVDERLK